MRILLSVGLLLLAGCSNMQTNKPTGTADGAMSPDARASLTAANQDWTKLGMPGDQHQKLEPLVGRWKYTLRWRMNASDQPQAMSGTHENTWVLGKRFIKQSAKGGDAKQAFEGLGLTGYDNVRAEYTSIWLDNMGTGMMNATGQFNADTNTIEETGTFSCPMTGTKNTPFRSEMEIIDRNHYTYDMYTRGTDGKEFKSLEIKYERVA